VRKRAISTITIVADVVLLVIAVGLVVRGRWHLRVRKLHMVRKLRKATVLIESAS